MNAGQVTCDASCALDYSGCDCAHGFSFCVSSCVNTQFDEANCGGCGNLCPTNDVCVFGECKPSYVVSSYTSTECICIPHVDPVAGDDRGNVLANSSYVIYTGDSQTINADFTNIYSSAYGDRQDGMFVDMQSGLFYVFYDNSIGMPYTMTPADGDEYGPNEVDSMNGVWNAIAEYNPDTMTLTNNIRPLSEPIPLVVHGTNYENGVYSGPGYVIVYTAIDQKWRVIMLDSGDVHVIASGRSPLEFRYCENNISGGMAGYIPGRGFYIDYPKAGTDGINTAASAIVRYFIQQDTEQVVTSYPNGDLGDMCSFSVVPSLGRWFWHFEWVTGTALCSQEENLGVCKVSF